jgi:hypothetical protein
MRLTRPVVALAVLALVACPAAAQDSVPNPEFASWSKYKPGTRVTLKSTSEAAGVNSEFTMTTTLVEVGADKLVVETETVVNAGGMEFKTPGQKRDVPKSVAIPKGAKKENQPAAAGKPPGTYEEGTETLKVAGTEVKTKWYKYKTEQDGIKVESQMWMAEDFPGMLVKNVTKTSGTVASTTRMEVVEFKKP